MKTRKGRKTCDLFCKRRSVELGHKTRESSKTYKMPYRPPTKEEKEFEFRTCKKTFCNPKCEGYSTYFDKRKVKNGFQTSFSAKDLLELQQKGALSGCVQVGWRRDNF